MALRKAIWIRILIYVPLLGFFGWQAYDRYVRGKTSLEAPQSSPPGTKRTVTTPDGQQIDIYEMSPEEAERAYGIKIPSKEEIKALKPQDAPSPPAKAEAEAEAEAEATPTETTAAVPQEKP